MDVIYGAAGGEDANIIFGSVIDPEMGNKVRVTVVATGFDSNNNTKKPFKVISEKEPKMEYYKIEEPIKNIVDISNNEKDLDEMIHNFNSSNNEDVDYSIPAFLRNNKD